MSVTPPRVEFGSPMFTPDGSGDQPLVLIVDAERSVRDSLADLLSLTHTTRTADSGQAALEIIEARDVAIVLADQRLPDMDGVALLTTARRQKPLTVGVLMTAHADLQAAIQAINTAGVLGFVTKPWDEQELLLILQRAAEVHSALRQLNRTSREPQREVRLFEDLSRRPPALATHARTANRPLREAQPDEFGQLARIYATALGRALDQRAYKVDHHLGDALWDVARRLGSLSAGPRDVIDLHVTALREQLAAASTPSASALSEEGRLLVLELMGHVATYYRSQALGEQR